MDGQAPSKALTIDSAALLWGELLDKRPPDLLLVLDERLGLRRRHVPDRHADVGKALLHVRRIERLRKSFAQAANDVLRRSRRRRETHEADRGKSRYGFRNRRHVGE